MNSLTLVTAARVVFLFLSRLQTHAFPFSRPLQHLTLAIALLPMLTVVNSALPEAGAEHTSFPPKQLL